MNRRNYNFVRNPGNLANLFSDFWNSVPVYPSEEQINNATEMVPYDSETMNGQTCPITMGEFNEASQILQIRECGHIFNSNALRRWFRNHVTCPVCRIDIRNTNNSAIHSTRNTNAQNNNNVTNNESSDSEDNMPDLVSDSETNENDETNESNENDETNETNETAPELNSNTDSNPSSNTSIPPVFSFLNNIPLTNSHLTRQNGDLYFDVFFDTIPINSSQQITPQMQNDIRNFLSGNPSTSYHNPSTSDHNPSTSDHNPSTSYQL